MNKIKVFLIGLSLILFFSFMALIIFYLFMPQNFYGFDSKTLNYILDFRNAYLTPIMIFITFMGNWQTIAAFSILIFARLFWSSKFNLIIIFFSSIVLVLAFLNLAKFIIKRPRPDSINSLINAAGYSFPSGHSLVGSFFYIFSFFLISLFIRGKYKKIIGFIIIPVLVLLIAFSRVYLGVHWPVDVISGIVIGTILALYHIFYLKLNYKFIDFQNSSFII